MTKRKKPARGRYFAAIGAVGLAGIAALFALAPESPSPEKEKPTAPPAQSEKKAENLAILRSPPGPPPAQSSPIHFVDSTAAAGIRFKHTAGRSPRFLAPEILGSGVTVFDADGDGREDILFVNGMPWPPEKGAVAAGSQAAPPTSHLFRNVGGKFEDVTAQSGLGLAAPGASAIAFDWDGDGDRDVVFATVDGLRAFANDGRGRFREETKPRGLNVPGWTSVLAPLDLDDDGDLDLFVGRYVEWDAARDAQLDCAPDGVHRDYCAPTLYPGTTPVVLLNDGHGRFTDGSAKSSLPRGAMKALGVLTVDLDGDDRLDILIANDEVRTQAFLGRGDGTLREEAVSLGFAGTEGGSAFSGMGIDGSFQLPGGGLQIGFAPFFGEPVAVYGRTAPDRPFLPRSTQLGLRQATLAYVKFGLRFFDADLDGYDDLLLANGALRHEEHVNGVPFKQPLQLFMGGESQMIDASRAALGPLADRGLSGRALATIDYDGDGDLDAIVTDNDGEALLLENKSTPRGHFAALRLVGTPPNRDAIGAHLEIKWPGHSHRRWVHATGSYYSQSSLIQVVGLGDYSGPVEATVTWPSGRKQTFANLAVDRTSELRESMEIALTPRPAPVQIVATARERLAAALAAEDWKAALPLLEEAVAASPYEVDLQRDLALARWEAGRPREAGDAARAAAERAGDPNVVMRSVVVAFLDRGRRDLAQTAVEHALVTLPVVSTEIWTVAGQLRVGSGDPGTAERYFRTALRVDSKNGRAAVGLALLLNEAGRPLETIALLQPFLPDRARDAPLRRALGVAHYRAGNRAEAEREFLAAVAIDPADETAVYNLGQLALETGRIDEAIARLRRASELKPDDFRAFGNLGAALRQAGRNAEAREAYRRVLALRPGDPIATEALRELP